MNKTMGGMLVFLALVIAIVPIFTDCQSQGRALTTKDGKTVPMKCHWAGVAELGAALPLAVAGIANLRKQRKDTTRLLATISLGAGIMALLFPTVLIGVCPNPDMICNMIMRPTLIGGGILAIACSAILFANAKDSEMKFTEAAA
jgi:hypothetical protein